MKNKIKKLRVFIHIEHEEKNKDTKSVYRSFSSFEDAGTWLMHKDAELSDPREKVNLDSEIL